MKRRFTMRFVSLTVAALTLAAAPSSTLHGQPDMHFILPRGIPDRATQLVIVTTASWDSTTGRLQRLQRLSGMWTPIGDEISVSVGSKGLAWGRGLHTEITEIPQKREGDHRAPAGIFVIGQAFGYSRVPSFDTKLPYRSITDRDYFVDDSDSADYNRWVTLDPSEPNDPTRKWKSFEIMRRRDDLYEIGLVIQQNINPIVKGRGSAIFFHAWRQPGSPTSGCTSMSKENLIALIGWLDPAQSPILIQAPGSHIGLLTVNAAR